MMFSWITNGIENKQLREGQPLPEGFKEGMLRKKETRENSSHYKKGYIPTEDVLLKNRIAHLGQKKPEEAKRSQRDKIGKLLSTGWTAFKLANERIMLEVVNLHGQGFKCIPITTIVPDMIAIKDQKYYAVEVEYENPRYDKYDNFVDFKYDDVIWILRDRPRVEISDKSESGWFSNKICWQRIMKEVPGLEEKGYKCIPITSCRPDIVAIKNNKYYAVEVEYQFPKFNKYDNFADFKYDDIIWILRGNVPKRFRRNQCLLM